MDSSAPARIAGIHENEGRRHRLESAPEGILWQMEEPETGADCLVRPDRRTSRSLVHGAVLCALFPDTNPASRGEHRQHHGGPGLTAGLPVFHHLWFAV